MSDWENTLAACRDQLAPALFLAGDWVGEGHAHGEPVTATLRVRPILDATAVEVWETVGGHTDLSIYRFDPDAGHLEVLHLMPGALARHPVEASAEGLEWVTGPSAPSVLWTLRGDTLTSEVIWPRQRIAEVLVRYRRAPG